MIIISFTKVNYEDGITPIEAKNLNEIQDEILNHTGSKDNPHGTSIQQIGAAPAGYGLGGACVSVDDWDKATANGYYYGSVNSPDGQVWWGFTVVRSQNYMEQKVFRSSGSIMREVHRSKTTSSGTWLPWEYVNPPMELGVEYRTIERYLGKPVYAMVFNFGNLADNSTKSVEHKISKIDRCISIDVIGNGTGGGAQASVWTHHGAISLIEFTPTVVEIKTTNSFSGFIVATLLKYTKTTD